MAIKKIFVPLSGAPGDAEEAQEHAAMTAALDLGALLNAHVEAYHCTPPSGVHDANLPAGIPGSTTDLLIDEIEKAAERALTRARALFETVIEGREIERRSEPGEIGPYYSTAFFEDVGEVEKRLAMRARLSDIAMIGRGGGGATVPPAFEICLRETGRPVLAVPSQAAARTYRNLVIGWNGSAEAARALSVSADFLDRAETVTVIAIQEDGKVEPDVEDVATYLAWHGIQARVVVLEGTRDLSGDLLMEHATSVGADLLVMGAYTRTRLSRLIFGSVTAHVLARATMPVLMVH
jgi:nucleotide-binding universal stress UspA family protein